MRTVVCEDDVVVRGLISQLATVAGHEVIAETDNAMDAADLVDRFGASLVVLDLSLPMGSGADMLRLLRERHQEPTVIVFSSYAADEDALRRAGATAVIAKPDFDALEEMLASIKVENAARPEGDRRRHGADGESMLPPRAASVSVSGIEEPTFFAGVLAGARMLDALVVIRVGTPPAADGDDVAWADLALLDRRLAVARLLRETLRIQDRLALTADGELVALLINGGSSGPRAALARLAVLRRRERLGGDVCGGFAVHANGDSGVATLDRARRAAAQAAGDALVSG